VKRRTFLFQRRNDGSFGQQGCVITGAASGIGRATARRFAAEGASVVVADFDDQHGPEVAAEIGGLFVKVNVADEHSVVAMYEKTAEVYGGIDVLFNNAGISPADDDSILTTGLDAWKRVQDVNLTSSTSAASTASRICKSEAAARS